MKRKIFSLILSFAMILSLLGELYASNGSASVLAAEIPEQTPHKLIYNEEATDWESEALPLGNGYIGAMLFGGVISDRIQINEHTLWSGGQGSNSSYNGGNETNKTAAIHSSLMTVRQTLQNKMNAFTQNNSPYWNNGSLITANYSAEDETLKSNIRGLMGSKDNFGTYQTLGNIMISDINYSEPDIVSISTPQNPSNASEQVTSLFDGLINSKWFAGDAYPNAPYTIEWSYDGNKKIEKYSVTSANDMQARDPKAWTLYGSADGNGYTAIDSQSNQTFENRQQEKTYTLSNQYSGQAYKYYRLVITEVYTAGNPCQMSEISLQNTTAASLNYTNYRRSLDLDNSVANVEYDFDGATYKKEYFISYPDNCMAIKLTASRNGLLDRKIAIISEQTKKEVTSQGNTITMTGQPADQSSDGLKFAQQIKVINDGGTLTAVNGYISVENANSITIFMTAGTNYLQCMDDTFDYIKSEDPVGAVSQRLQSAVTKGYDSLKADHITDYKSLYENVKINFGATVPSQKMTDDLLAAYNKSNTANDDRYLESLYYQYGRYLLISSSREGTLPANLQGIWAQGLSSPWDSDYHTNINLQMNYWLAETTNLSECHMPLMDYINSLVPRGTITAQTYYTTQTGGTVRGWVTNHENNIWGHTAPSTYYEGFYFPTAAAWLCQDIYEYYKFNDDEAFIRENYDTMMSAALFWVDNLWTDSRDNTLVSNPSYSPEHGVYSLGASCDQEIIYELFREVIEISDDLNITSSELNEVKTAMAKLYVPKIGLSGKLLEWKDETTMDITGDNQHRHANHLFLLYPGSQVSVGRSEEDNEYAEAIKSVLNTRGDGGTGWSKAWKICFWARLHDGDHAMTLIQQLLGASTLKNLFDTHPPFQIDGNFGATAGMTEMLLQSQSDYIQILPSLPSNWATGKVAGLKARGDFEVDINWENSTATDISILSNKGNDCTVKYTGIGNKTVVDKATGQKVTVKESSANEITFATTVGVSYEITDSYSEPCNLSVTGVAVSPASLNDGDDFKAYATVRNTGESATSQPIQIEFSYDGVSFETVTYSNTIAAGGMAIITVSDNKSSYFGSHSIVARIIGDNTETDYTDNRLKVRYKVMDL